MQFSACMHVYKWPQQHGCGGRVDRVDLAGGPVLHQWTVHRGGTTTREQDLRWKDEG